jgi:hypothetical protein
MYTLYKFLIISLLPPFLLGATTLHHRRSPCADV